MLLSTRDDAVDDVSEAQKANFSWNDPNLNDLGSYMIPRSARRFDEVASFDSSNPAGTLTFQWVYGSDDALGAARSIEIWGRIDPAEDSELRESFRVARRRFEEGGVVRPLVKTRGRTLSITWTLPLRALR